MFKQFATIFPMSAESEAPNICGRLINSALATRITYIMRSPIGKHIVMENAVIVCSLWCPGRCTVMLGRQTIPTSFWFDGSWDSYYLNYCYHQHHQPLIRRIARHESPIRWGFWQRVCWGLYTLSKGYEPFWTQRFITIFSLTFRERLIHKCRHGGSNDLSVKNNFFPHWATKAVIITI